MEMGKYNVIVPFQETQKDTRQTPGSRTMQAIPVNILMPVGLVRLRHHGVSIYCINRTNQLLRDDSR